MQASLVYVDIQICNAIHAVMVDLINCDLAIVDIVSPSAGPSCVIGRRARSPSARYPAYITHAPNLPTEAKDISIGNSKARFLWMSGVTQPTEPLVCVLLYHLYRSLSRTGAQIVA
jgi:hypothetical protein